MTNAVETGLERPRREIALGTWLRPLALALGPILAALVISSAILLALGVNPLDYYAYVLRRGLLSPSGIEATLTRMAPLLLLAASLIVAFRAGIWNLGGDGQFLLGAVIVAAMAPALVETMPPWAMILVCSALAILVGALWSVIPALLKAYQGVNEIITTLMMTFLGASLANVLVKLAFLDPATTVPQTRTLPSRIACRDCSRPRSRAACIVGLVAVVVVHLVMTRTAFGLKLRVVGASPRAAVHAGLSVPLLTLAVFAISAGAGGTGRRDRHPRRLRQCPRRLEPGLQPRRHPARLPRPLQRFCLDRLRVPVLGAVDRRRERGAPHRRAEFLHAGRRRDPADLSGARWNTPTIATASGRGAERCRASSPKPS